MKRREFLIAAPVAMLAMQLGSAAPARGRKKDVSNADGTEERKLLQNSVFDYRASFSADGKWIVFTSERNGLAVWTADGSGKRLITDSPWEDSMPLYIPAKR